MNKITKINVVKIQSDGNYKVYYVGGFFDLITPEGYHILKKKLAIKQEIEIKRRTNEKLEANSK